MKRDFIASLQTSLNPSSGLLLTGSSVSISAIYTKYKALGAAAKSFRFLEMLTSIQFLLQVQA
jgi:hypothetical protein